MKGLTTRQILDLIKGIPHPNSVDEDFWCVCEPLDERVGVELCSEKPGSDTYRVFTFKKSTVNGIVKWEFLE